MCGDAHRLEQRRSMTAGEYQPSLCLTVYGGRLTSQAARIRGRRQTYENEDRLTDFRQNVVRQCWAE